MIYVISRVTEVAVASSPDVSGQSFGSLTAIEKYTKKGRAMWLVKCICGNSKSKDWYRLSRFTDSSCRCTHKAGKNHALWKGIGDISGNMLSSIRSHARKRGRKFTLSPEYLWELFLKQDKTCALSGLPISFSPVSRCVKGQNTASLDRINSSLDYIEGNVQWVHKDINTIKSDFDEGYFIYLCTNVSNYRGNK
jgi:hypothetical protein